MEEFEEQGFFEETDNESQEADKQEAIVVYDDDPEQHLALMKKRAKVAGQLAEQQDAVLVATTDPTDWVKFGDQMRLSSVGAEKVARNFGIKLSNWSVQKEDFSDKHGPGYIYTYSCDAELAGRKVHAQGICSTRDKFLCKANKQWRPIEDINTANIMQAAYHRCQGNAIKAILGIRSMHIDRWKRLFANADINAKVSSEAKFNSGNAPSKKSKKEPAEKIIKDIGEMLMGLAREQKAVRFIDDNVFEIIDTVGEEKKLASESLKALTTFVNDKGEVVEGKAASLRDLSAGQAYYVKKNLTKLMEGQ